MTPDIRGIISVIDSHYAPLLHTLQNEFAPLDLTGGHRRFAVARMGSTGSSWLAKLLNSHPDVTCSHEGVIAKVFPKKSYGVEDISELIQWLACDDGTHGSYSAAGDVGSVWWLHLLALRGKFKTGLLVRHPARILNTRLHTYYPGQPFCEVTEACRRIIRELWDIEIDELPSLDAIFLQDLCVFVSQISPLRDIDIVLRLEDLQDPAYCQQAIECLTGVRYDESLIAYSIRRRVHERTKSGTTIAEILRGFNSWQRQWYLRTLRDAAPVLGYDLDGEGRHDIQHVEVLFDHVSSERLSPRQAARPHCNPA
jgi:hypothetical protein